MLKLIRQFITGNAQRLSSQLSDLESNVATETADIRASFMPALAPLVFLPTTDRARTLLPGQVALCDTGTGSVNVVLSCDSKATPGFLAVIKRTGTNTLTVIASGRNATAARQVNLSSSKAYTAQGLVWLYFDGSNWWSA